MKTIPSIEINLDHVQEGLKLCIDPKKPDTLFDAEASAVENNEARFQLYEGHFYDYTFNKTNYQFIHSSEQIVQPHTRNKHTGTISPNIFVGTLSLPFVSIDNSEEVYSVELEVQSIKSGYRDDYRDMLEFITEKCTDLLLQANSPASHYFEIDYTKDSQTLYQRFAFIKSVIGTDEFTEAIHRIVTAPVTTWASIAENKDIRQARRFSNTNIRDLLRTGNRSKLPEQHYFRNYGLNSLPERISTIRKTDSVDTPENRFIKHALETFLKFLSDINKVSSKRSKLFRESEILIKNLETHLHHSIFKEITRPYTLKLNSPVLQRKEGYREVLKVWLMFDLAAKLIWTGGDDVYSAGKKDIATLYEYWLFFKLLELFNDIFDIEAKDISDLIQETNDGLNLQLKQGKHTALKGVFNSPIRKLNIRFSYNRSFGGKKTYPDSGSWTTTLRPDYTLSVWPVGITEADAEEQELIVHIHFDAKYKVDNLLKYISDKSDQELDEEKTENRKGVYKNADLLKMHAYKDAIRRTGGAYVLYPGDKSIKRKGFHEIIPGLGAFPVKPSKTDTGIGELKAFILDIAEHFITRTSQREKFAFRTYDVHKKPPTDNDLVKELLPEPLHENRGLIPDETFVLVGFYEKDKWDWIIKTGLYNARAGSRRGSLRLGPGEAGAKYLLLHTHGETVTGKLLKIIETGPRVFSKQTLIKHGYPTEPSQGYYLVYKVNKEIEKELIGKEWDITKLDKYKTGRGSGLPFAVSLAELMQAVR